MTNNMIRNMAVKMTCNRLTQTISSNTKGNLTDNLMDNKSNNKVCANNTKFNRLVNKADSMTCNLTWNKILKRTINIGYGAGTREIR